MASRHLTLLHCENAMPAVKWLYDYPGDYAALELAKGVFSNWPIAFGTFEKIEKPVDESAEAESYLTITEHDIPPLPEQKGIPFWDQEWITPELKELLFAQPNDEKPLNTYFIVDATLRKKITGFFDLDALDLPVKCLFKGEAAEELKEVAPYLLDMTLPEDAWDDNDKIPGFHKDFFENHWAHNTGLFIRTTASFDDLWRHLRQFPHVLVEEDQHKVFFRFWDPRIAPHYFSSIKILPEKVAQWINIRDAQPIECLVGNIDKDEKAWSIVADKDKLKGFSGAGIPMLSAIEMAGFRQQKRDQWVEELLTYFKEKDSFYSDAIGDDGFRQVIHLGIDRAAQYGLTQQSSVTLYIHTMLYLGSYFDTDPLLSWAKKILNAEEYGDEQADKANALWQGLVGYLQTTCGDNGEYLQRFMRAFQQQIDNGTAEISNDAIFPFIEKHYPEKAHYMGRKILHLFIEDTQRFCQQHHLYDARSVFYLSYLRLVYGIKVTEDPLFPWFKIVHEKDSETGNKDDSLARETHQFYNSVIAHIEGE